MIYITGDTHGERLRFIEGNMQGEDSWNEQDTLIVCGDFGYIFTNRPDEQDFLDFLAEKSYTICFCDGNHENFTAINSYPVENWNGGSVHRIRKNILHLMRGQVFEIEGKKIFTMGGAYSMDKYMRREGLSWWSEELPTNDEYRAATQNLRENANKVDIIITHTAPREIIRQMCRQPDSHDAELTGFLEWVMREVSFTHWFFGHWHRDAQIDERFRALWFDVVPVE